MPDTSNNINQGLPEKDGTDDVLRDAQTRRLATGYAPTVGGIADLQRAGKGDSMTVAESIENTNANRQKDREVDAQVIEEAAEKGAKARAEGEDPSDPTPDTTPGNKGGNARNELA